MSDLIFLNFANEMCLIYTQVFRSSSVNACNECVCEFENFIVFEFYQ